MDNWENKENDVNEKIVYFFKKGGKWLLFFTKFDQMSRVGSRDRHTGWGSKKYDTI